jgi:hypothetical protein
MASLEACKAGLVASARAIASFSVQVFDGGSEARAIPVKQARSSPRMKTLKYHVIKDGINPGSIFYLNLKKHYNPNQVKSSEKIGNIFIYLK